MKAYLGSISYEQDGLIVNPHCFILFDNSIQEAVNQGIKLLNNASPNYVAKNINIKIKEIDKGIIDYIKAME